MGNDQVRHGAAQGELDILGEIRRRTAKGLRGRDVGLGIGDDCALLRPRAGEELAITTDLSIAGRHFRLDWHPPEVVGRRTLARGLSDLAAMGARPVAAFLSLGVPRELTVAPDRRSRGRSVSWVQAFLNGFFEWAKLYAVPLAGGDLAESPVALADIVLVGAVPRGKALLRSGARPGDLLYVTGTLGGAAAGLARLAELACGDAAGREPDPIPNEWRGVLSPQMYPKPRVDQGLALRRRRLASAAIDISDGLSTDLAHLCEESGVSALVEAAALPVAPGASLGQALHGGEDYELLFTVRPGARVPRTIAGVPLTKIGRITKLKPRQPVAMLAKDGNLEPLHPRGWQHFA